MTEKTKVWILPWIIFGVWLLTAWVFEHDWNFILTYIGGLFLVGLTIVCGLLLIGSAK